MFCPVIVLWIGAYCLFSALWIGAFDALPSHCGFMFFFTSHCIVNSRFWGNYRTVDSRFFLVVIAL